MTQKTGSKEKKKQLEIIFGVIVTLAALYFFMTALRGLNPTSLLSANINWWLAFLSVIVFALSALIRAFVYPYGIDRELTVMEAFQIVAIGNAANMVLPFHAGDALRFALFPKKYGAAKRVRLLLIPGFADISVTLLLSIAAVYIADFKAPSYVLILKIASYGFLAFCALTLLVLLSIRKTRASVISYLNRGTLRMLFFVAVSWLTMLLSIWIGFLAFGYGPIRSIILTIGAFAGMNIAGMVPSSPGGLGIFEWSVTVGLAGLGISEMPAKMAGLMLHLIQYAAIIPIGIILYIRFFIRKNSKKTFLFTDSSLRRAIALKK